MLKDGEQGSMSVQVIDEKFSNCLDLIFRSWKEMGEGGV